MGLDLVLLTEVVKPLFVPVDILDRPAEDFGLEVDQERTIDGLRPVERPVSPIRSAIE